MEKKVCLECGEPIKGRSDKKFCNDLCRNAYNNKLNSDTTNFVRNVNNILRKNRRILEEQLNTDDKKVIAKQKLVDKGFNFKYYTHQLRTKNSDTYIFCYEFGYLPIENERILIVKKMTELTERKAAVV
ncbi:MAG: hypothetical protein ACXVP0_09070 [Bacteroidia bacterium]